MEQWYYADMQRQQQGPVSPEVLRDKFNQAELALTSLVWREGMANWQPLSTQAEALGLLGTQAVEPPAHAAPSPAVEPVAPSSAEPATDVTPAAESETRAGLDLRADYATAADTATAANTAVDDTPYSPYTAPAAPLVGNVGSAVSGGEIVYAGFWKRVAAYFLDSLIVGMVGGVIAMVLGMILGLGIAGMGDGAAAGIGMILLQVVINLISIAIAAAYYAGFHASANRATLGKMAVGIKVVRLNGEGISILRGIGRYFAAMLSGLVLCIGFVMAAFTERKQGLHDMLCDTLVVDKWAFTENPEWQQRGLGTVTIVILALFGLLLLVGIVAFVALIGVIAANA
jgi:uncharacterized RDD family membrane protein YckC